MIQSIQPNEIVGNRLPDRTIVVSNLSKSATELSLRHFLHGSMVRLGLLDLSDIGSSSSSIAKVNFLSPPMEHGGDSLNSTIVATVEFQSEAYCQLAASRMRRISFQGRTLHLESLPRNGTRHMVKADNPYLVSPDFVDHSSFQSQRKGDNNKLLPKEEDVEKEYEARCQLEARVRELEGLLVKAEQRIEQLTK